MLKPKITNFTNDNVIILTFIDLLYLKHPLIVIFIHT
jgi:hypothetical protein